MSLSLDNLPPLKKNVDLSDVKSSAPIEQKEKPFILACSRNVEPEELELLKSYGAILIFHESFRNIPLSSHKFNYALFDLREKTHRDAMMKEDLTEYNVVCIVSLFDSFDDFVEDVEAINCIRTFPARQAFKQDFDRLLVSSKIRKPSCLKAVVRSLCFLKDGWPRK
jgi:hypothetical protein